MNKMNFSQRSDASRYALAILLGTALMAGSASPTYGSNWDTGEWRIEPVRKGQCVAGLIDQDAGTTRVEITLSTDGQTLFSLMRRDWGLATIKHLHHYRLHYVINPNTFEGGITYGLVAPDGWRGYVSEVVDEFLDDLAAKSAIEIWKDDKLIAALALPDTANAMSSLKQCVADQVLAESAPRDPS